MSPNLAGLLVGVLAGVGLWYILVSVYLARPTLAERLAPLIDLDARNRASTATSALHTIVSTAAKDLGRGLGYVGSTHASVAGRLATLGRKDQVGRFRTEQLAWSAVSLGGALLMLPFLIRSRVPAPIIMSVLVLCGIFGALARDTVLSWQVRRYRDRLGAELPDVVELLALAISAGEGPVAALTRVAHVGNGDLAQRLRELLSSVNAGRPLTRALRDFGSGSGVPVLERFADSFITALERGTPLTQVLHGIAQDTRAEQREHLMESGGKREIGMLVPVVFLILPVSVLFALYPGLYALRVIVP